MGRRGGTKLLLRKPNLRGAQNAEAILRTYHRSRLRPPLPSRPPSGLSTPSKRANGRTGRVSCISLCTLCLTYQYSRCPFVPLRHVLLPSSPPCLRHENGRSTHLGTTGGLLKNALAPSAKPSPSLSLSQPSLAHASLRGKCFRP